MAAWAIVSSVLDSLVSGNSITQSMPATETKQKMKQGRFALMTTVDVISGATNPPSIEIPTAIEIRVDRTSVGKSSAAIRDTVPYRAQAPRRLNNIKGIIIDWLAVKVAPVHIDTTRNANIMMTLRRSLKGQIRSREWGHFRSKQTCLWWKIKLSIRACPSMLTNRNSKTDFGQEWRRKNKDRWKLHSLLPRRARPAYNFWRFP